MRRCSTTARCMACSGRRIARERDIGLRWKQAGPPPAETQCTQKTKSLTLDDLHVPHAAAPENFGDDRGRGVARPFAMTAEDAFGLANAASARRGELWRGVLRPQNPLGDVREHVTDRCVGLPPILTDDF